jgi:hypothetical protein
LKKRQDSVPAEDGVDNEAAEAEKDADPSTDSETSENVDSKDYEYEDEDPTDLAEKKTCLGGLPKEYCAAVVQILLFIGLFIGGFIPLR